MPPSALTIQTRGLWPSVEANAIRFPSGDQTPPRLKESRNVNCLGPPPVMGITNRFARPSYPTLKTTDDPSGEMLGRSMSDVPVVSCLLLFVGAACVERPEIGMERARARKPVSFRPPTRQTTIRLRDR